MAPFRRFKRFTASEGVCCCGSARTEVSFGFETCQMRIGSRPRDWRKGNECAWIAERLRLV